MGWNGAWSPQSCPSGRSTITELQPKLNAACPVTTHDKSLTAHFSFIPVASPLFLGRSPEPEEVKAKAGSDDSEGCSDADLDLEPGWGRSPW